jgi:pimeloyl-ACP methyl ester carboxylesterase
VQELDLAPAHFAGNSFGASIVLGLASRRPELLRSVIVHEPPLLAIVEDGEVVIKEVQRKLGVVIERLRAGDILGGARQFVEEIAFGPGGWDQLPSLSGFLCARHSMTQRSMNATQDEDRHGGPSGAAAHSS